MHSRRQCPALQVCLAETRARTSVTIDTASSTKGPPLVARIDNGSSNQAPLETQQYRGIQPALRPRATTEPRNRDASIGRTPGALGGSTEPDRRLRRTRAQSG